MLLIYGTDIFTKSTLRRVRDKEFQKCASVCSRATPREPRSGHPLKVILETCGCESSGSKCRRTQKIYLSANFVMRCRTWSGIGHKALPVSFQTVDVIILQKPFSQIYCRNISLLPVEYFIFYDVEIR